MPVAWGFIVGLSTIIAVAIRVYIYLSKPSDPTAAVVNDAWVQARLRGDEGPPPLPDTVSGAQHNEPFAYSPTPAPGASPKAFVVQDDIPYA
jgi:hypothetical protein